LKRKEGKRVEEKRREENRREAREEKQSHLTSYLSLLALDMFLKVAFLPRIFKKTLTTIIKRNKK